MDIIKRLLISFILLCEVSVNFSLVCKENEVLFLERCWCEPGWDSANNYSISSTFSLECTIPVLQNGDCDCESHDKLRSFLNNPEWQHSKGYRCTALCRWNRQVGVPRSMLSEWKDNQGWKQLSFYTKDLPKTRHTHLRERLDEFATAFHNWEYLNNTDLGNVLELGAGGYTQLRNIMERVNVKISHATLLDPLVDQYSQIKGCSYHNYEYTVNGKVIPALILNQTVEYFGQHTLKPESYDTVIVMNVLVYSQDAFQFLETIYRALKPNGLLLFHDRWFNNHVESSKCKTAGFYVNVLQVSKQILDHFVSFFTDTPFRSTNQTSNQLMRSKSWCGGRDDERSYWMCDSSKTVYI